MLSPAVQLSTLVWWLWGAGGARLEAASGGRHRRHRGGMGGICTKLGGGGVDRGGHPHLGRSPSCVASHGFQKGTEHGMTGLVASGF